MLERLISDPARLPKAGRRDAATIGIDRWREAAEATGTPELARFASDVAADDHGRALLEAVFGNSPYLGQCLLLELPFAHELFANGPDRAFQSVLASLRDLAAMREDETMRLVRSARRRTALLVGLADIAGTWPLERVTAALSDFADAALTHVTARLLHGLAATGAIRPPEGLDGTGPSGFIILGMGKLGARELNYSSDIDIIVLYDHERMAPANPAELQKQLVRLTHTIVRHLSERTADGYVFRTDLRLRPDPGSTPPALSTSAAEVYYESLGQNWERAAFIKARPVAGDRGAGAAFLSQLRPFIWRRHLDFAAIQDIHSIKRQINAHHGSAAIAVAGQNLKLGRGGIREIEMFAQTQQLIWGGRDPQLRVAGTCEALKALAKAGRVEEHVVERLIGAYRFLRTVEHRLQMVADEQTHSVPEDEAGIEGLATFLGYTDGAAFGRDLIGHLQIVEGHYAELFEEAPALSGPGNLVFTGADHDPETLRTIASYGFTDPVSASSMIRGWHHGRYRAMRSTRARELLTELTPALLAAFSKTSNPGGAFAKFDEFLSRLPAGVQLFSLFYANPGLLDLVAEIMGEAPSLAGHLSRRPAVLDAVLLPGFFEAPPPKETLADDLARMLRQANDFQDTLDIVRRWTHDRKFQVGVQMLRGAIDGARAGAALSDVADCAIAALLPAVEADFARSHGRVPGAELAVAALGKMGGREMTMSSDLDLLFIYDGPSDSAPSDGARPLAISHYYQRLSQRFVNAVTALTEEGSLYEVDMRLRPSGQSGPLASSLESFVKYHGESAWTWEHMALTRARIIAGSGDLARRLSQAIRSILAAPREPARLAGDVYDMRLRIEREHGSRNPWDVKHVRGGLLDVEFIAQFLQLRHAATHQAVLAVNTTEAFDRLAREGLLVERTARDLAAAGLLWRQILALLRLTLEGPFEEQSAPQGVKSLLAKAAGVEDFAALKNTMNATARQVRRHFKALIVSVAEGQRATDDSTKEAPRHGAQDR
ncbi:MAG: bifunctional [glutamine synthetase] adenylyltransferase/[glutamine synthetase]-adenylyl-L-tyrosine phosphorylase [Alphaproteobacteria bacterium]